MGYFLSVFLLQLDLSVCEITTLGFTPPEQCEYNKCLARDVDNCKQHLPGFYDFKKSCLSGQICSLCTETASSLISQPAASVLCNCENPPFTSTVLYGQPCDYSRVCETGECFRPCSTYLHSSLCPRDRCVWNISADACSNLAAVPVAPLWDDLASVAIIFRDEETRGELIVSGTVSSLFPLNFAQVQAATYRYQISGEFRLEAVIDLRTLFLQLDVNTDGLLDEAEFGKLPVILKSLETKVSDSTAGARRLEGDLVPVITAANIQLCLELTADTQPAIREACQSPELQGLICQVQGKVFCALDATCKLASECSQCGWQTAVDPVTHKCVNPTPTSCKKDNGKVFCPSSQTCVANMLSACQTGCPDNPALDSVQGVCMPEWWNEEPSQNPDEWVCRYRRKPGQPCVTDMDCIYGKRQCNLATQQCEALPANDAEFPCLRDTDCPPVNFYCPQDPTLGEDPFWVQYCRSQKVEGEVCAQDRECGALLQCNFMELPARCRTLFSLAEGVLAEQPELCISGYADAHSKCANPAKSLRAGLDCDSNADCPTSDPSGALAQCRCKAWWAEGAAKTCQPVFGDFRNHGEAFRDFLFAKAVNCGKFWTHDECLQFGPVQVNQSWLRYKCEEQILNGGPFLPPAGCGDDSRTVYTDYCALVTN